MLIDFFCLYILAERTNRTIAQANRLINGLASENVRWLEAVDCLLAKELTMPGDCLLTTAFVSYAGVFPKEYRQNLLIKDWLPFIKNAQDAVIFSEDFDPVGLLVDDAQIASWNNEGLPSDRTSVENAAIISISDRWPLLIDPQLQGIKWIKGHYPDKLCVINQGIKELPQYLENCIIEGNVLLVQNVDENLDSALDPIMNPQFVNNGTMIKMGDKNIQYHPDFRLIIHTISSNPHFRPELQAQTTLVNFSVTRDGLEEQLLVEVVRSERPDLEKSRSELVKQANDFKIALKSLEDDLLSHLSKAQGGFLADTSLVDSLEHTKATAIFTAQRAAEAAQTAISVNEVRELYRPVAARASLMYFVVSDLHGLNPLYQFSLKAFIGVFQRYDGDKVAKQIAIIILLATFEQGFIASFSKQ